MARGRTVSRRRAPGRGRLARRGTLIVGALAVAFTTSVAGAGPAGAAGAVILTTSRTAFSETVAGLNSSATWNPTVVITIPAASVAGTYTGVVTHSAA
jgi:hypothetical protein